MSAGLVERRLSYDLQKLEFKKIRAVEWRLRNDTIIMFYGPSQVQFIINHLFIVAVEGETESNYYYIYSHIRCPSPEYSLKRFLLW